MKEETILKKEFQRIKKMNWVKAEDKGSSSIGVTLEKLLGKNTENFEWPDFLNIELKTHRKNSMAYTTLFNATPDGKYLFEIKRLRDQYGYPDHELKTVKVFQGDVRARRIEKIGAVYSYSLEVNDIEERVYLCIYDRHYQLIDKNTFWSFQLLEEKLLRKLSTLAYIEAEQKRVEGQLYFKYTSLVLMKLKDFSSFLKLLKQGRIIITFTVGVFKTGKRIGEIHDHGTAFRIANKDLVKLFNFL